MIYLLHHRSVSAGVRPTTCTNPAARSCGPSTAGSAPAAERHCVQSCTPLRAAAVLRSCGPTLSCRLARFCQLCCHGLFQEFDHSADCMMPLDDRTVEVRPRALPALSCGLQLVPFVLRHRRNLGSQHETLEPAIDEERLVFVEVPSRRLETDTQPWHVRTVCPWLSRTRPVRNCGLACSRGLARYCGRDGDASCGDLIGQVCHQPGDVAVQQPQLPRPTLADDIDAD